MAIIGKSSYIHTVDLFITHWLNANVELGPEGPLVVRLEDGSIINLPGLRSRRDAMRSSLVDLQEKVSDAADARQTLHLAKIAILFRARSFVHCVRGSHGKHPDIPSIPNLPALASQRGHFIGSLLPYCDFWEKLNALPTGEIRLPGKYQLWEFKAELSNLETVWLDADTIQMIQQVAEEERDAILKPIPKILLSYRENILNIFGAGSPMAQSLPELYSSPGHIPAPVEGTGVWDARKEMGKITWERSTDPNLRHYEIRYSPGDHYNEDVESTIAVIGRTAPTSWLTLEGLREKGRTSLFKIYVVLQTGKEAAGNTIAITKGADAE